MDTDFESTLSRDRERASEPEGTAPERRRRTCSVITCGTHLSRYNPGDLCGIHTRPDYRPSHRW